LIASLGSAYVLVFGLVGKVEVEVELPVRLVAALFAASLQCLDAIYSVNW
jgi:hypothetical protein